ncbi:hypothetical protein DSL72_001059 [Monilinia vaccinii-corymbosi]|uniref:GH16 domain-containing protein n=1 Tax=Monilinia vaccinii-corymbosi TaxID=61207 RepID=A0A8A3P332_9HELO|nr:hypothetical protein DSL72_001059 [Monilinia vaccinii-corymbosi]
MQSLAVILFCWFSCLVAETSAYTLVHNYDHTNWYTSFIHESAPDPTHGNVNYVSLADAQRLGLTKIVGKQVFMGVDNTTVLSDTVNGKRNSIWVESVHDFTHGILIGDFAHMPGSDCGTWPGFWTIRNGEGPYGEIDILEGANDVTEAFISLHTEDSCTFTSAPQVGTLNNGNIDCQLSNGVGCSVRSSANSYGTPFNNGGGGVYAMQWTSTFIRVWFFPRNLIPADITAGSPDPIQWGLPTANFESADGGCDIDANFPAQTVYFDTTFCGAGAGGKAWSDWSDCPSKTGYATCAEHVAQSPHAFDEAYWLVNSVKIYQ